MKKNKIDNKPAKVWHSGMSRIAQAIAEHFKTPCTRTTIRWWLTLSPPFPAAHSGNRYDQAECFGWVETHKKAHPPTSDDAALMAEAHTATQQLKIIRAQRERFTLEQEQELYILKRTAEQKAVATVKKYHSIVRDAVEGADVEAMIEKLKEAGLTETQLAAAREMLTARAVAIIDLIEARCAEDV